MPGDPKECRRYALRCADLAHTAKPVELKLNLLGLALRHHANALLEATYFDDVRVLAAR